MFGWCSHIDFGVSVRVGFRSAALVVVLDLTLLSAEKSLMSVPVRSAGELLFAVPALVRGLAPVQVQVVLEAVQPVE